MVAVPSAIILVNNDLVDQVRSHLVTQLHITEVIDGYVFDDRIAANSSYPDTIRADGYRLMVVRSFAELESRELADVAIFIKNGLASVLKNNFGPPGATFEVLNLHWGQLCIFQPALPGASPL